jgi:hypothetical protein
MGFFSFEKQKVVLFSYIQNIGESELRMLIVSSWSHFEEII